MDPKSKATLLLEELIAFSRESKFAVEQDNWPYLQEILQKKNTHLTTLQALMSGSDMKSWGLGELGAALHAADLDACAVIERKMAEARKKQAELDALKNRTQNLRQISHVNTPEQKTALSVTA